MLSHGYALAASAADVQVFLTDLVAGVGEGDLVSLFAVGLVGLVVLRFVAAPWVFTLVKQLVIFGGLGAGVWFGSQALGDRYGSTAGHVLLFGGGAIVVVLLVIMLYAFFERGNRETTRTRTPPRRRARAATAAARAPQAQRVAVPDAAAQPTATAAPTMRPAGVAAAPGPAPTGTTASAEPLQHHAAAALHADPSRLEETLHKLNVLGTSKDQNLLTVMVLILVAEFGVFTSKTIAAPSAQVGMVLFAVFALGAVVFVKTSYKDYLTGVRHFVFATVFALALSLVMLVYWQGTYCDPNAALAAAAATADCSGTVQPLGWSTALDPRFYFASDGLIATISAVAFSTLLTKGG